MKRKLLTIILALLLCQSMLLPAQAVVEEIAAVRIDGVAGCSPSDGVYTVVRDGLYGYYFANGTELAAPAYVHGADFQNGMAAVALEDGLYGYIDLEGRLMVSAQYRRAFPFSQDRAFAVRDRDGVLVLLDAAGGELASFPNAEVQEGESIQFSEGLAVIPTLVPAEEAGETEEIGEPVLVYQVVDLDGEKVCTLTDAYVDYINGYHNGRIAAAEQGEWTEGFLRRFQAAPGAWGYRDTAGELAVAYQYDEASPFSDGVAGVGRKGDGERTLYGFIDAAGSETVPMEYDGFVPCENGFGAVRRDGRWAYVDKAGQFRTGFRFSEVSAFSEGTARVRTGERRCVVDESGTVLFAVEGAGLLPCSGGVIPAQNREGLWGIYDKSGELLVDFSYDEAFHWDGYLWLKRGGLWRVYLTEEVVADRAAAATEKNEDILMKPVAAVGTFSDVAPDAYYAQAVTWATDSDIVTGTGGGQFSPDRSCTTGEIVMCLWRAAGRPEPKGENPFTDVSPNHYYYQAALWAYEKGLASGEAFGAAEPCTRAMVVTYLWSLDGSPYGQTEAFTDVPPDAPYAQAVAWALSTGITEGNDSGRFDPDGICSRGQIVTFLYRYMAE